MERRLGSRSPRKRVRRPLRPLWDQIPEYSLGGVGKTPHKYMRIHCQPLVCQWAYHTHGLKPLHTVCAVLLQAAQTIAFHSPWSEPRFWEET